MKKFGFYALGLKGYECLNVVISEFGSDHICFVVAARDKNIADDYFEDIKTLCFKNNIAFSERNDPDEKKVDLKFAIGWRWIIPNSEDLIVFHDSLLPRYRGFSPLVNALIRGESEIGVTALRAESDYDSGDILAQKSICVEYPIKISSAIKYISDLYCQILVDIYRKMISEEILQFYAQDQSKATYSPWRNELDYKINWESDSQALARFIDAVGYPYRGAETTINGEYVRIFGCEVVEDVKVESRSEHIGKVIFMNSGLPTVICGDGLLQLKSIVDQCGDSLIGKIPFRSRFGF